MGNWIANKLIIKGEPEKLYQFIKSISTEGYLDFEKIIPSPKRIEDCPEKYINKDNQANLLDQERPWFNEYLWCTDFWECPYNANGINSLTGLITEIESKKLHEAIINFDTHGNPAILITYQLIKQYADLQIELKFYNPDEESAGTINSNGEEYYSDEDLDKFVELNFSEIYSPINI